MANADADLEMEALQQKATGLLQGIDNNIVKATGSVSNILADARQFSSHAKSVHTSIQHWGRFLQCFSEPNQALHDTAPSPVKNTSFSFALTPSTPTLASPLSTFTAEKTWKALATPNWRTGETSADRDQDNTTPSFGASPPRSVQPDRSVHEDSLTKLSPVPISRFSTGSIGTPAPGESTMPSFGSSPPRSVQANRLRNSYNESQDLSTSIGEATSHGLDLSALTQSTCASGKRRRNADGKENDEHPSSKARTSVDPFDASKLPSSFRSGEGAKQVLSVYNAVAASAEGVSVDDLTMALKGFEPARIELFIDTLASRCFIVPLHISHAGAQTRWTTSPQAAE